MRRPFLFTPSYADIHITEQDNSEEPKLIHTHNYRDYGTQINVCKNLKAHSYRVYYNLF